MATATLTKWGNGQGIRLPKALCRTFGLGIGDKVDIREGADDTLVIEKLPAAGTPRYERRSKLTAAEVFAGWQPSADFEQTEFDWGADVGAEVVE